MPLKVLIVPDKFKGTLIAHAAAEAIAKGWRRARPRDRLELLPMSDGGDGFGEVISQLLEAQAQTVRTVDAAHRPCRAQWGWEPKTKTAIIESARVIGLAQLPHRKFHPFDLNTFGLGAVLRAAANKGAKRCLVGIGGSATNDGGFGFARAIGWQFLDDKGDPIERWTDLDKLVRVRGPATRRVALQDFMEMKVTVAVDVQNLLLGPRGCSRVYGPQKGLRPEDFPRAERCLRILAGAMKKILRRDVARVPGAGAAGGLGFGLMAFLGARAEPGFDLFARYARLEQRLRSSDLVITGEGQIDRSTLMGKGVGEIARRCRALGVPCVGLAGTVADSALAKRRFTRAHGLTELTSVANAKARPAFWLEALAAVVAEAWKG